MAIRRDDDIEEMINSVILHAGPSAKNFAESLRIYFEEHGFLTEGQYVKLDEIHGDL